MIPPEAVEVGKISEINLFPVKSMQGIVVETATCTHTGLKVGPFLDR